MIWNAVLEPRILSQVDTRRFPAETERFDILSILPRRGLQCSICCSELHCDLLDDFLIPSWSNFGMSVILGRFSTASCFLHILKLLFLRFCWNLKSLEKAFQTDRHQGLCFSLVLEFFYDQEMTGYVVSWYIFSLFLVVRQVFWVNRIRGHSMSPEC